MATVTKDQSIALIERALTKLPAVLKHNQTVFARDAWARMTRLVLVNIFEEGSRHVEDFDKALTPYHAVDAKYELTKTGAFLKASHELTALLNFIKEEVELFWPDEPKPVSSPLPITQAETGSVTEPSAPVSNNVFIIHGHDHGTKEEVARFLSKAGLNPIILHEHANRGRAIIEKFERYADVPYAVALLTPDDMGAAKAEVDKLQPRPRQNVLFEFGYFIGKLGRENVCGLAKGGVEIPSDYSGVLLIPLDNAGAWRLALLKELRDAKLPVDVNSAL
jgi:hypothetical protein